MAVWYLDWDTDFHEVAVELWPVHIFSPKLVCAGMSPPRNACTAIVVRPVVH